MGNSGFTQTVNAQNQINGFSYDAAGRLLSDSLTSYTYDDDGMLLSSSDGTTYVYDALNQRAQTSRGGATKEYYYFAGQLIATSNPAQGVNGWTDFVYAGGQKIATVAGNQTATPVYTLPDHLGSEVATTNSSEGSASALDYSPFGQILSGTSTDPFVFTSLERDTSGLDHAGFRMYSSGTARWTTPDPYDGSYQPDDPQSLNRYAYIKNRPLGATDPSGLSPLACGFSTGAEGGGIVFTGGLALADIPADIALASCIYSGIEDILHLFGKPKFKGSLTPRANARVWDEHGSYSPKAAGISDLFGLPSGGCEFGVCSFQQSGNVPNVGVNCRGIEAPIPHTNIPLGDLGAQHCDATVSIGDGWLYSLSAGPIGDRLRGFVTKTHTLPTGATNFWRGRDGLGLAQCLIGAATGSQNSADAPQYHPVTGPNSNIWLNGIFSSCGVNLGIKTHGPYF